MQTGDLWNDGEMSEELCKAILLWMRRSRHALLCPDEADRLREGASTAIETLEDRLQDIERRYQSGHMLDDRMYEDALRTARRRLARRYRYAYEKYLKIVAERYPEVAK